MPPMDLYTRGSHAVRRPLAPQSSINTEITGNKSSGNGKMFNAQTTFIEHYHESEDLSETRRTIGASASHRQKTTMSRLLSCGDNNAPPLVRVDEEERHVMHRTTNFSHDVPHMESIEKLHAFGIKVEAEYGNLSNEWINWSKVQTKRTGRRRGNAQRIKISTIRMDIDAKRQDFLAHQRQLISILHDDKHPICRVMDTMFGSIYDALKSRLNILEEAIALLASHQSTSVRPRIPLCY
ncbi:hypothetical protein COL940_005196 [Colletotrichum noveboracense]|nr:hypothetical protein COL940_005196 [Colletotrichum noveboracense]